MSTRTRIHALQGVPLLIVASLLLAGRAHGQGLSGPVLNETFTASVSGISAPVAPDGSFLVANIPSGPNYLVVDLVGNVEGVPIYGQSEFFLLGPFGSYTVQSLTLSPIPIQTPASLTSYVDNPALTAVDQQTQMHVVPIFSDGLPGPEVNDGNVGTSFFTSNPEIATIDENGVVTAVGEGMATLTANNRGAATTVPVFVSLGDPLTTVQGFVFDEAGAPVSGALVSMLVFGGSTTTDSDGFFCFGCTTGMPPTQLGGLSVLAEANIGGEDLYAIGADLDAVPGGLTDAGVLTLRKEAIWISTSSGSWSDGSRWSTGAAPAADEGVRIEMHGGYTVTVDVDPTVEYVILDHEFATLSGASRTLTTTQDSHWRSGTVSWRSSTWAGGATVFNAATAIMERSCTIDGDVEVEKTGLLTIRNIPPSGSATLTVTGTLENSGELIFESTNPFSSHATLSMANAPLQNTSKGLVNLSNTAGGGGNWWLDCDVQNDGTIEVRRSSVLDKIGGTYTNDGTWKVKPGGKLFLEQGGTFVQSSGELRVDGTFDIEASTFFELLGGTIHGNNEPVLEDATLTIDPGATDLASLRLEKTCTLIGDIGGSHTVTVAGVPPGGTATLLVPGGVDIAGTLLMESTGAGGNTVTLDATGGTVTTTPTGSILVNEHGDSFGGQRVIAGNVDNGGSLTVGELTTLNSPGSTLTNTGALTITTSGEIQGLAGGTFTQETGTLILDGDLEMDPGGGFVFNGGDIIGNDVVLDAGDLTIGPAATGSATFVLQKGCTISGDIQPSQTVVVQALPPSTSATTTATAGLTNLGILQLDTTAGSAAATLAVTGGPLINEVGALLEVTSNGTGARAISAEVDNRGSMVLRRSTTVGVAGADHVNTGTIEADQKGTFTGSSLTNQAGGIMEGDSTFDVAGVSFLNDGTVRPGTTGLARTLSWVGSFVQSSSGRLEVDLGGLVPGTEHDVLALINSSATLDGTLEVNLIGGFMPQLDDTFDISTFLSSSGSFGTLIGGDIGGGLELVVSYPSGAVRLTTEVAP
jgi:hypothetical protein